MIDIEKLGNLVAESIRKGHESQADRELLLGIIKAEAMDRRTKAMREHTKAMENIGQALFAISKSLDPLDLS